MIGVSIAPLCALKVKLLTVVAGKQEVTLYIHFSRREFHILRNSHTFVQIQVLKVTNTCNYRLSGEEADRFAQFETKFKKFMYGGVTVQHLKPNSSLTRDGMTRREKRTLWLMLPEVGSLRLGLVSKMKDNGIDTAIDDVTVASSAASSRAEEDVSI